MGGEGSGRKPDFLKQWNEQKTAVAVTNLPSPIILPNYSGVQQGALKGQSGLASGAVLFANSRGEISDDTSKFYIDGNGNVGIGTTTPRSKIDITGGSVASQFHVSTDNTDTGAYFTTFDDNSFYVSGGAALNSLGLVVAKSSQASFIGANDGDVIFSGDEGLTIGNTYTPTQRAIITRAGNFGIGSSATPGRLLTISKTDTTNAPSVAQTAVMRIINPSTTVGDGCGVQFGHSDADAQTLAMISEVLTGTSNQWIGDLTFNMKASEASTTLTEYMRLQSGGALGIGATSVSHNRVEIRGQAVNTYAMHIGNALSTGQYTGFTLGYSDAGSTLYRKAGIAFSRTDSDVGRGDILILNNNTANSTMVSITDVVTAFKADGKVGIGTTTPGHQLEVVGRVCVSGASCGFRVRDSNGISAAVTSGDLVGKTMTFSGGILISYA